MKNIQVIDSADNCTFSLFQATDEEFGVIFPGNGQDMEFSDELFSRLGEAQWAKIMTPLWQRPILKSEANGIHGTLFFGFKAKRSLFPESKRERDYPASYFNEAQRQMYNLI